MKNLIIRYGIISSVVMMGMFGLTYLFVGENYDLSEKLGYASILISMIFVFLGIREYRDKVGAGHITFWQAIKVGLMIVAIPSIVFGLFNVIYVMFIDPEFMENFYQKSLMDLKATSTAEEYAIKSAEMESQKEMFMNPFIQFLVMGMTVFLMGIVTSILSSFVLKKESSSN